MLCTTRDLGLWIFRGDAHGPYPALPFAYVFFRYDNAIVCRWLLLGADPGHFRRAFGGKVCYKFGSGNEQMEGGEGVDACMGSGLAEYHIAAIVDTIPRIRVLVVPSYAGECATGLGGHRVVDVDTRGWDSIIGTEIRRDRFRRKRRSYLFGMRESSKLRGRPISVVFGPNQPGVHPEHLPYT